MVWVSVILASSIIVVIVAGLWSRGSSQKGIGWQFIRFTVLAISLPICALLALNNALTGEAATLIAGAMGYAFGKSGEQKSTSNPSK
tara:strand:- start:75 stop:335 length:261 start_codon:yes stop_codon:yes gene_type:complete